MKDKVEKETEMTKQLREDPEYPDEARRGSRAWKKDIVVVGGIAIDTACDIYNPATVNAGATPAGSADPVASLMFTSNPARMVETIGGVGYNISDAIRRQSLALKELLQQNGKQEPDVPTVRLVSAVGDDAQGRRIIETLASKGVDKKGIRRKENSTTARYVAINGPDSNLLVSAADMHVLEQIDAKDVEYHLMAEGADPKVLCADGNLSEDLYSSLWLLARQVGATTVFEPTSVAKSTRVFAAPESRECCFPYHDIDFSTPNSYELAAMSGFINSIAPSVRNSQVPELGSLLWNVTNEASFSEAIQRLQADTSASVQFRELVSSAASVLPFIPTLFVKLGAAGVLLVRLIPAPPTPFTADFSTQSEYNSRYDAEKFTITSASFDLPASLADEYAETHAAGYPEVEVGQMLDYAASNTSDEHYAAAQAQAPEAGGVGQMLEYTAATNTSDEVVDPAAAFQEQSFPEVPNDVAAANSWDEGGQIPQEQHQEQPHPDYTASNVYDEQSQQSYQVDVPGAEVERMLDYTTTTAAAAEAAYSDNTYDTSYTTEQTDTSYVNTAYTAAPPHTPASASQKYAVQLQYFPPLPVDPSRIVTVNGAGDTFLASLLVQTVYSDGAASYDELVNEAQRAAVERLYTVVPPVSVNDGAATSGGTTPKKRGFQKRGGRRSGGGGGDKYSGPWAGDSDNNYKGSGQRPLINFHMSEKGGNQSGFSR